MCVLYGTGTFQRKIGPIVLRHDNLQHGTLPFCLYDSTTERLTTERLTTEQLTTNDRTTKRMND